MMALGVVVTPMLCKIYIPQQYVLPMEGGFRYNVRDVLIFQD